MFNFFKKCKERSELIEKREEIRDKISEKLIEGSKLSQQAFIALSENSFKEAEDYGSGLIKTKRNIQEFIDYCWWGKDVSYSDFELVFAAEQVDEDGNVWTSAAIVGTAKLV